MKAIIKDEFCSCRALYSWERVAVAMKANGAQENKYVIFRQETCNDPQGLQSTKNVNKGKKKLKFNKNWYI